MSATQSAGNFKDLVERTIAPHPPLAVDQYHGPFGGSTVGGSGHYNTINNYFGDRSSPCQTGSDLVTTTSPNYADTLFRSIYKCIRQLPLHRSQAGPTLNRLVSLTGRVPQTHTPESYFQNGMATRSGVQNRQAYLRNMKWKGSELAISESSIPMANLNSYSISVYLQITRSTAAVLIPWFTWHCQRTILNEGMPSLHLIPLSGVD